MVMTVFFTITACSKKDNDPVLFQVKLSDYKGLWKLTLGSAPVPPYAANAVFNLNIQDQQNFTITFPRNGMDTTINGNWKLKDGTDGFVANYLDRTDSVEMQVKQLYKYNGNWYFIVISNGNIFVKHKGFSFDQGPLSGEKQ